MRTSFRDKWQCVVLLGLLSSWNAAAQDKSLVKLKQLQLVPRNADLRSEAKTAHEAKWEVQSPTVKLPPPANSSHISELTKEVQQGIDKSHLTSVDVSARSAALHVWDKAGKQVRKPIEKAVKPSIEEYRKALSASSGEAYTEARDRQLEANITAQETVVKVFAQTVENRGIHSKDLGALKQVHDALKNDEQTIRDASIPLNGITDQDTSKPVVADYGSGRIVATGSVAPEAINLSPPKAPTLLPPSKYTGSSTQDTDAVSDELNSLDIAVAIYYAPNTPKEELKGTGFLIGRNLLLTAGHVLGGRDAYVDSSKYEVLSQQSNNRALEDHWYPLGHRVAYGTIWAMTQNDLDFALFEVDPGKDKVAISDRIQQTRTVTCLNFNRPDSIYLVGYPQATRKRSKSAGNILYPFHVNEYGMGKEVFYFVTQAIPQGWDEENKNRIYKDFIDAHRPEGSRRSLVMGTGSFGSQPVYAVKCDARPGHSGSPVFSQDSRQIIGIFIGGQDPSGQKREAIWPELQFVLPIEPVLEQLDHDPQCVDWQQKYGVQVVKDVAPKASASVHPPTLIANQSP